MSFDEYLLNASKSKLRLLYIRSIKRRKDFFLIINRLLSPYYCGVILDFSILLKFGENLADFLADIFRMNYKSILMFPMITHFLNEKILEYLINLGIDALILDPEYFLNENLSRFLHNSELGIICYGYFKGAKALNSRLYKNLTRASYDAILTLNADKRVIDRLKLRFNKILMNMGGSRSDILIEEY